MTFNLALPIVATVFVIQGPARAEPPDDPTKDWPVHFDPDPPRPPTPAPPPAPRFDPRSSYVGAMALCDGIAVAAPLMVTGLFLLGQGVLYFYANLDTTFPAEPHLFLGALGGSAVAYLACGPATHIAHGHAERAGVSLLVRFGLPATALGLTYLFATAASAGAPSGDRFGPSGGEAAVGFLGAVAITSAFVGAIVIDYGLAARPTVLPALAPVPGGFTAGLSARW